MEKIDCLFVHVPKKSSYYKPLDEFMCINYIPMGVFALSDLLVREGYRSRIVHLGVEWIEDREFSLIDWLADKDVTMIGLPLHWHYQSFDVLDVAAKIRARYPDIFLFLGGYTSSYFAREILEQFPAIDAVIRGDGENPLLALTEAMKARPWLRTGKGWRPDLSKVLNLAWRRGNEVVVNPIEYVATTADLDRLNFTHLSLLQNYPTYVRSFSLPLAWSKYFTVEENFQHVSIKTTLFPLCIGRGCPVECSFCGGSASALYTLGGRKEVVFRSPEKVIDSILEAQAYGYKTMQVCFDPTPHDDTYFVELFRQIRERKIEIDWYFECWALPTERFVREFKRTFPGENTILAISPESGSERIRCLNKGFTYTNEEMFAVLDLARELDLAVDIFFTIGIAHDTMEEAMRTKEIMADIYRRYPNLKRLMVWSIQLEPGAPQFEQPEKYGIERERTCFMDFYRSHSGLFSDTYSALGYRSRSFFIDREGPSGKNFAEQLQEIKCDQFCFLHPDPRYFNPPEEGRQYCEERMTEWKARGRGRPPATRDVFH